MPPRLPGWCWNGERLVMDDSPEGALARRMVCFGGCRLHPECTRRVALELGQLIGQGLGRAPLQEVRHRYECSRRPHCGMSWADSYPEGVPLQAYAGDPDVWLSVTCEACKASQLFTPERVIQALELSGRGDGNTGVRVLAGAMRRPCTSCRATRWRVELERVPAPGRGLTSEPARPKPAPAG